MVKIHLSTQDLLDRPKIEILFISRRKHMVWVLIRSAMVLFEEYEKYLFHNQDTLVS